MFEPREAKKLGKSVAERPDLVTGEGGSSRFNLAILSVPELMRLHDDLIKALPPLSLSEMNLEKELLMQYHSVRALQNTVMDSDSTEAGGIPMNQRAQVANTVASCLKQLIDLQDRVFAQERFKFVERLLIRSLTKLPEKTAARFLTEYEEGIKAYRA